MLAVYNASQQAIADARNSKGPFLLECLTYRVRGHARFEQPNYRPKAEEELWKQYDPILRFKQAAISEGVISEADLQAIDRQVEKEIEDSIAFAQAGEDVEALDYKQYIYSGKLEGGVE